MIIQESMQTVYVAFGDASSGDVGTFYGFVIIPEIFLPIAIEELNKIKVKFGGAEWSRIHCRELFNDDRRLKSEWSHLSLEQAIKMCSLILEKLGDLGVHYLAGIMDASHYPETLRLRGKNGHKDLVHLIDNKWRELWMFHGVATFLNPEVISTPPDPIKAPSPLNMPWWRVEAELISPNFIVSKVYLDRENTKIQWFSKKFQWTTVAKDFVIRTPQGKSFLPIQSIEDNVKHPMLDVADIFIWNLARSFGKNPITFLSMPTDVQVVLYADRGKEIVLGG